MTAGPDQPRFVFVNLYEGGSNIDGVVGYAYETRTKADASAHPARIACAVCSYIPGLGLLPSDETGKASS